VYLIGSVFGSYAYYRRQLVWPMMLTTFFIVINAIGVFVIYT